MPARDQAERRTQRLIALLAIAMFINYVDRGNLATAAPLIKDELHLSNTETGVLLSAFFWTYTPFQLIAGWLAERWGPHRTLALGVALWSIATFATGLVGGFTALLLLRLLLGVGESATFPCNAKLLTRALPPERLGAANGTIGMGQALGPAIGTFGGGLLMAMVGWRPAFLLFGIVSALWLIPWAPVMRREPDAPERDTASLRVSYAAIFARRDFWGAALGHFSHNYGLYFLVTWLPLYLVKARGFSLTQMAVVGGALYLIFAVSVQASGVIADSYMASGRSGTRVRKSFAVSAHIGIAACLLACATGDPFLSVSGLLAAGLFLGMNSATIYPIGQTLGFAAAGEWMGAQNFVANIAGIIAPIVTGWLVDREGGFGLAFAVAGLVMLAGTVFWGLVIRRIEPLAWA